MASETPFHNRMYFLCPKCKKAPYSLPGHLRKVCMKDSTEPEIQAVVLEAKKELSEFTHRGRFWEYQRICDIFQAANPMARMISAMQESGFVIRNLPAVLPAPAQPSTSFVATQSSAECAEGAAAAAQPEVVVPQETSSDESSGEFYQSMGGPAWSSEVRVEMVRKGLYNKHSIDHPLLAGFNKYLHTDLGNKNSKQEVEAVSRFMYYMDPSEPNLLFVRQVEKVREYFNVLSETKLSKQTVLNYWKSVKRFIKYTVTCTDVRHKDPTLYEDCKTFMDPLYGIHCGMAKKVSKEVTQKRFHGYGKEVLPTDCHAVLEAAFMDFMSIVAKLQGPDAVTGESLSKNERLLFLYYLEAIIMLKHLQRPGVVTNMTVEEWQGRKQKGNMVCVAVKEHKTATSQIAEVPLSDEQECWFDLYFNELRPLMLKENSEDAPVNTFFVSSTGRPIYNPSNDLKRLQEKYNLPGVSCGEARKAFETAAKNLPEVERNAVARLLGHTPETAEKHYRMKTPGDACLASSVLDRLVINTRPKRGMAAFRSTRVDEQTAYNNLQVHFPVTLEGPTPKRARREQLCSTEHERHCYDRWRTEQHKLRERHALEHFSGRRPSETKINNWLQKQGWKSNIPQAAVILNQWKPVESVDMALNSDYMQSLVRSQIWKGLTVTPVPDKGNGVFATRPFQNGEVVCDFHGRQTTKEEGMVIAAQHSPSPGHLFFYKNKNGDKMCIDAHEEHCECHPESLILGRIIRHSGKRANIRPRLFNVNDSDVILFIAIKNISKNEELLYDYGSKWRFYSGKGLELEWN